MGVSRLLFCLVCLLLIGCAGFPSGAAAESAPPLSDASPPLSAAFAAEETPGPRARREAATVYCLSRPSQMTVALLALGLSVPGAPPAPSPTSGPSPWPTVAARTPGPAELQAWAVHHRKDFDRACDALIGARSVSKEKEKKGTSAWVSAGKVIGPLLLGALLTLFTTEWRAAQDRGRKEGLELRRLGRRFFTEASDYAERRGTAGQPSAQGLHDAARELALSLEEIKARHPWWRAVSPVRAALAPDELDAAVTAGWSDLDDQGRKARHAKVTAFVHGIDVQVGRTARALEHPWRPPVLRWIGRKVSS
ncbi:hypothetical protein GWI34_08710 [Actinomadura sp. DSM 109109]|nr:hypothetical protein [Actinomadura lepetitiana]